MSSFRLRQAARRSLRSSRLRLAYDTVRSRKNETYELLRACRWWLLSASSHCTRGRPERPFCCVFRSNDSYWDGADANARCGRARCALALVVRNAFAHVALLAPIGNPDRSDKRVTIHFLSAKAAAAA